MPIPAQYHEPLLTPQSARNVEAAWTFSAPEDGSALVLPDGRCDVILRYSTHNRTTPIPAITGPATRPYEVKFKRGDTWVGLRLRPGFGAAIWGDELGQATNRVLRGPEACAVLPDLKTLSTATHDGDALQAALLHLPCIVNARPNPAPLQAALDALHASGGRLPIAQLAQMVGCSARHLGRLFRRGLGLSAKTYAGLVRFHRAVALLKANQLSLSHIAFEAGFADHAHMSREMQTYGGFAPSRRPAQLSQPGFFG